MASATLSSLGQFEAAEGMAQQALELQPDFLFGLWVRGLALCGLGRSEEAIEPLERSVVLSLAPIYVGSLGFGVAIDGRQEDAWRLLSELEDRGSRGEYLPTFARLTVNVGLGDLPGIRGALANAVAEPTPPVSVRVICGRFLEAFRSDAEIDRLHHKLYGW